MGYYTNYNIHLSSPKQELIDHLELLSNEVFEGDDQDVSLYSKWYDSRDHLAQVTKEFPNIVVTVTGFGEDCTDIWCEYWLNGNFQYQCLEIKFKPLYVSNLKKYIKGEEVLFN